jgi:hypothetical protein
MKKVTILTLGLGLIYSVSACFNSAVEVSNESVPYSGAKQSAEEGRQCASMDVLAEQLKDNPGQAKKMEDIEKHTKEYEEKLKKGRITAETGVLTIPVVVHVIYNTNAPQQNISDAQIQSQITVLNRDFSKTNADVANVPSAFASLATDMRIQFQLVSITRKASNKTQWGTRDDMKKPNKGGVAPVSPSTTLNMWVCNIGGGILGYAQFPGGSSATDGIVVGPQYFGSSSLASGFYAAPYDKGRTATHEVGHWLNLRHIWGDASCGNDLVADTPTQQTSNGGCPTFPKLTCGNTTSGDMFMNYMDYTNDACMYMFSTGQRNRSWAIFAAGGARASFNP